MNTLKTPHYNDIVNLCQDYNLDYVLSCAKYHKWDLSEEQVADLYNYIKPIARQEKQRLEDLKPRFILACKGEFIFEGSDNECWMKLLRVQSQSTIYAMKYEGYTINLKQNEN